MLWAVARGGGCAAVVHYRSRMTKDRRRPTMPGQSSDVAWAERKAP